MDGVARGARGRGGDAEVTALGRDRADEAGEDSNRGARRVDEGVQAASGPPLAVLLALVEAAVASGLDVRSALAGVARALAPTDPDAAALALIAQRLGVGLAWEEAWADAGDRLGVLRRALASSWRTGSSPVLALRAARQAEAHRARAAADAAAARLAVQLTVPLAMCLLPAFVLVGVVPLLLSIAASVEGQVRA